MILSRVMAREYRAWCRTIDPDYHVRYYPLRGRLFETWKAAWMAALKYAHKGESND